MVNRKKGKINAVHPQHLGKKLVILRLEEYILML